MADPFVFDLRFQNRSAVERGFDAVSDEEGILSVVVEPAELRIRFSAPPDTGTPLVEKLYARVGFVWCTRYPVVGPYDEW